MDALNDMINRFFRYDLSELPFVIISLVIAFTLHEFAHAYVAYKFGDPTAKKQGRLTLNPAAHLDVFGTLMILLFGIGWARPVPVNRYYFKRPRLAGVLVSLAGPLSNLLIAFVGILLWEIGLKFGLIQMLPSMGITFTHSLFQMLVSLNIMLFVFNLIPIPPLDGYRIIADLVPVSMRAKMTVFEQYGGLIFLVIIFIPELSRYTIQPIFMTLIPAVSNGLYAIINLILGY